MSEQSEVWFDRARELPVGQALFIRVANADERTALARELEEEKEKYSLADAVHASQLFINKVIHEKKLYVVVERKYRALFTGFVRNNDGGFTKITVDPERKRMLRLMVKDGKGREEIEETLNGLTEEEVKEFFS